MKHLSTYKLFEASSIKTDKSLKSVAEDVLADLIDENIVVEIEPTPPIYTLSIRTSPIKMGFSKSDLIPVMDISPYLLQLISFLEGDYLLTGIVVVGWEKCKAISDKVAKNPLNFQKPRHPQSVHVNGILKDIPGRRISHIETCQPNQDKEEFLKNIMKEYQGKDHYIINVQMTFQRSNASIFKYKLDSNEFHLLHDDSEKAVVLDKYLNDAGRSGRRVYYINFKNSKIGALKLVYDLNSRRHQNFKVYDNYNTEIDFNKLEVYLMKYDMNYGTFNDAWYYIEDNFNNQGYT